MARSCYRMSGVTNQKVSACRSNTKSLRSIKRPKRLSKTLHRKRVSSRRRTRTTNKRTVHRNPSKRTAEDRKTRTAKISNEKKNARTRTGKAAALKPLRCKSKTIQKKKKQAKPPQKKRTRKALPQQRTRKRLREHSPQQSQAEDEANDDILSFASRSSSPAFTEEDLLPFSQPVDAQSLVSQSDTDNFDSSRTGQFRDLPSSDQSQEELAPTPPVTPPVRQPLARSSFLKHEIFLLEMAKGLITGLRYPKQPFTEAQIDVATFLLRCLALSKNESIDGLNYTRDLPFAHLPRVFRKGHEGLQILSPDNGNHWVLCHWKADRISIYDSGWPRIPALPHCLVDPLRKLTAGCFSVGEEVTVTFPSVQRQSKLSNNGGVFAVAFAVLLICRQRKPERAQFDARVLRNHFQTCCISAKLTEFPTAEPRTHCRNAARIVTFCF